MKVQRMFLIVAVLCTAIAAAAGRPASEQPDASAAFATLKTLVGEWEGTVEAEGGKAHSSFELIGNGSALVQRDTYAGPGHATMLTVYHMDGDRLLMTHFCEAGNQPRLELRRFDPAAGELEFTFLNATNLPSMNVGHIHHVKHRLVDHDHLLSEWQFYENGKVKEASKKELARVR